MSSSLHQATPNSEATLHGCTSQLLNHMQLWVQIIDDHGRVVFTNHFAERISGYTAQEFATGDLLWEVFFDDKLKGKGLRLKNICLNLLKDSRGFSNKMIEIVTRAGDKKRLLLSMDCLSPADSTCAAALLIGIDYSFETNLLKDLKAREQRYHNIFRNAPIGFFRSLPEGKYLEVNETLAHMLGFDNADEVLQQINDIGQQVYFAPELRQTILAEVDHSSQIRSYETVFKTRHGKSFDGRINMCARFDAEFGQWILEGTVEDITERIATGRELHDNLLKLTTMFENSPIAMWEIDYSQVKIVLDQLKKSHPDLKKFFRENPAELARCRRLIVINNVNEATLKLLGRSKKEDLFSSLSTTMDKWAIESEVGSFQAFADGKDAYEQEITFKTLAGETKNVIVRWVSTSPGRDYSRVLVSMVDITTHRREQEALQKSKNELASLFSAMDDLVFIFDEEGHYNFVAPSHDELLAAPREDLPGKYLRDFFKPKQETYILDNIRQCLQKQKTVKIEYSLMIGDKEMWFEASISPLSLNTVIAVARDITERHMREKAHQIMLNISKAVSFTNQIDDLFEIIRTEISSLIDTRNFFISLYDEAANRLSLPYFKDENDSFDSFPAEKTMSALVIETKESLLLQRGQLMQLIRAGTIKAVGTIPQIWLGIPLIVEGRVIGVMAVQDYQDANAIREEHKQLLQVISPQISLSIVRKQAEERLCQSEQELRDANITKDRFFNIIAHDLKNPFNAIIGFSNLLCDEWPDFDDDDKITMVNAIRQSSEGAYELLMNLLEWSRLRVGTIDYHPALVDINNVVERSISLLKSNADEKNIRLTFEPCDIRQVFFDDNMLRTIIRNLLSNAIKFTYDFGVINITTFFDPNYPAMLRLSIADSGIGIAPEKIKTLFSLTETSSTSGTAGESGTGLGLILCKEFIDKNGGEIWVESTLGSGSTFHLAIPIYEAARKSSSG